MTHEEAINLINNSKEFNEQLKGYLYLIEKEHNTNAMMSLGNIYYNNKNIEYALTYYKKAANFGNPMGYTMLGFIYYYGRGVEKDYSEAFKYFTKGALNHEYHSILKLSDMYKNGYYLRQDYSYALNIIEPLYNEGLKKYLSNEYKDNPFFDVCMRYADSYKDGLGLKKDLSEALNYYTLAYNGFIHQMDYDKYDTYNKLKYCLNNMTILKKELNKEEVNKYDLFDFVFDKTFKFDFVQNESSLVLNFNFKSKEILVYPNVNRVYLVDNISFTFNNVSKFNKIEYDELRPIDYIFKNNTFRLYDEESTLMHFDFESFSSNIKIYPNFYDLILRLEKGSAKLRYSKKEEIIEVSLDNSIIYNGKTYKSIDDFILNEVELKKKFDQVFEII